MKAQHFYKKILRESPEIYKYELKSSSARASPFKSWGICLCLLLLGATFLGVVRVNSNSPNEVQESLITSNCPSLTHPNLPALGEEECEEVTSLDAKFRVFNCKSLDMCQAGYIKIQRINQEYCELAKNIRYSQSPVHSQYFGLVDGPDTFYVNFTGAQKLAVSGWKFNSDCSYHYPYNFYNSGEITLNIVHVYENFNGVNEVSQEWPQYLGNIIVQDHIDAICPQCPTLNIGEKGFGPGDSPVNMPLSICSYDRPVEGAWIPTKDKALSTSGYLWSPIGCRYPYKYKSVVERTCLKNSRSILFTGDSQIRVTFDSLWRRLEGQAERVDALNRFLDRTKVVGNVTLYHHKDVFLEDIVSRTAKELLQYDVIVFNFAQWPASGPKNGGHWTTEKYLSTLTNVTNFLIDIQNSRPKEKPLRLIWHGIHAFSSVNPYSKSRVDWRTNSRLKNWDVFSEALMKAQKISAINSFHITYPMIDTSPDKAHYFGTDAEEAIVDETLHKLDLCNSIN
ncbi:hypothetical protein K7432_002604 [Basidiobolus ranarum]|uniref:Uncharacterized protein n=1 Tax=Basidiobolus ranarum TaxID=34480 RepID=A0ABR2W7H4_9FUNG